MNLKRFTFALVMFSLVLSVPALANSASGEVKISSGADKGVVKFNVVEGANSKAGDGFLHFSLAKSKEEIHIKVSYVKVDGEYAWFAGECTQDGVSQIGLWFFGAVHDGGKPGKLVDHIWWEWLPDSEDAESIAGSKVENLEIPSENKTITDGDITVN